MQFVGVNLGGISGESFLSGGILSKNTLMQGRKAYDGPKLLSEGTCASDGPQMAASLVAIGAGVIARQLVSRPI